MEFPNFATDLLNPDFAACGDARGGAGIRVATPAELEPAVLRALSLDLPVIVNVDTDPRRF